MPKRRVEWSAGDLFGVPLQDSRVSIGQVLDLMMVNVVRCALYDETVSATQNINLSEAAGTQNLIALVACTREQLDKGFWKILGNKSVAISTTCLPNEQYRSQKWVGAKVYDAAIVESFLNGFHALAPWDDWFDPQYLDRFLISPDKKPSNLILIKSSP